MSSAVMIAKTYDAWETADDDDQIESLWRPSVVKGADAEEATAADGQVAPSQSAVDESQFDFFADELAAAATASSSTRRLARHPAYVEILSMGKPAVPLLLRRVSEPGARPVWLALLSSMTSLRPSVAETIDEAAFDWVAWGKREGLI